MTTPFPEKNNHHVDSSTKTKPLSLLTSPSSTLSYLFSIKRTLLQKSPQQTQDTMANFTPLRPLLRAANSSPASILTRSGQRSSPFSSSAANKFARLTLVGNLGADPEHITTPSGKELLKYSVATNQVRGGNREVSWFRIAHFLPAEGPGRDFALGLQKGLVYSFPFFGF